MNNKLLIFWVFLFSALTVHSSENSSSKSIVHFTENKGQFKNTIGKPINDVLFLADNKGYKTYLLKNKISYVFAKYFTAEVPHERLKDKTRTPTKHSLIDSVKACRVDVEFAGSNPNVRIRTEGEPFSDYQNYYYAHCPNGITNVKSYRKIVYENVYDNIDLIFYSDNDSHVKYDFTVKPGGDPNSIRLRYTGIDSLYVNLSGELNIFHFLGKFSEPLPYCFQRENKKKIAGVFRINKEEASFQIGDYDKTKDLIIDPWATYLGGSDMEYSLSIATDKLFNVVVSGATSSIDFPVSTGAFQSSFAGYEDVFITKFDASGSRIWSTYYGGISDEIGTNVACDGNNDVYVTGTTDSSSFPVTVGAFQTSYGGGAGDAFVLKLNSNGIRQWCTFYGGSMDENLFVWIYAGGVTCDNLNNVIITGYTSSTDFPVTTSCYQNTFQGGSGDGFLVKFDSNGNRLWGTYFGGNDTDYGGYLQCDNNNNVYLTGSTTSSVFPITPGAFQSTMNGNIDFFISKFDPLGSLAWSTFYGGTSDDWAFGIAYDSNGFIAISGQTTSMDFPISASAIQQNNAGSDDEFVVKFDLNGKRIWGTYFGGTSDDHNHNGNACAVDPNGNIAITGNTYSLDYPVTPNAIQPNLVGVENLFITQFDNNGKLICSSYYGCVHEEFGSIAIGKDNMLVLTGYTPCDSFLVSPNASQPVSGGGGIDAFVVTIACDSTFTPKPHPGTSNTEIIIPNVFSPNSDGVNDVFIISGVDVHSYFSLRIFNRWGEAIFISEKPKNYWDGRDYLGDELSDGTYYYVLTANGKINKGFVTLLR